MHGGLELDGYLLISLSEIDVNENGGLVALVIAPLGEIAAVSGDAVTAEEG